MPQQFRYLTSKIVEQLGSMDLVAHSIVEGFLHGLHRSPHHGSSVEFSEYREYTPGDPLKFIDWQVYGRTDRFMIRQFEEETNLRAWIVLDGSASMNYRFTEENLTKFQYACYLAASLIYLLNRQRDAAGLVTCQDQMFGYFPPRVSPMAVREMLLHLETFKPEGETGLSDVVHRVADMIQHRSLVIVISDLLEDIDRLKRALMHLRHMRNEIILFQILDEAEIEFPYRGLIEFEDMESDERMEVESVQLRDGYRNAIQDHLKAIASICANGYMDYHLLDTRIPVHKALAKCLARRRSRQ